MNMNKLISKTLNVSSYVAFALASLWSLYLVFFGLDLADSFYFCCKFLYGDEVYVFLPLTHFVMNCGNWLFGDYVIAYRLINWLFYYLAYLCLFFFVESINNDFRKYGLWILSLALVFMTNINTNVFSGESISAFFLVGSFISMYKAIHANRWWLIGLSASVALCVLSQFPNIVLIPLLLATGWLLCTKKSDYWYMALSVITGMLLYVLINCMIYGGWSAFWNVLSETFSVTTSQGEGADHSASFLLSEYLHTLKDTISDIKYLAILSIIPLVAFSHKNKYVPYLIALVFVVSQLLFIKLRVDVISDVYNYFLIVYFYAIIFIAIYSILVLGLLRHDKELLGFGIVPLCISICAPAGSDSGLCLLGGVLFAFIPWFVSIYKQMISMITKKELVIWILSLAWLGVCAFVYVREGMLVVGIALLICMLVALWFIPYLKWDIQWLHKEPYKNGYQGIVWSYTLAAIMAICLILYAKNHQSFEWVSPKEFTCQHKFNQMKYIWTNPRSCQYVEEVMNEYYQIAETGKSVAFFGHYSYVFSYLTHIGAVPGVEFTQTDIPRNIDALEQHIADKDIVVILSPYDPARQMITVDEYPKTIEMLQKHGYMYKVKDNKYAIFYPTE